jgi:hypothetical protein
VRWTRRRRRRRALLPASVRHFTRWLGPATVLQAPTGQDDELTPLPGAEDGEDDEGDEEDSDEGKSLLGLMATFVEYMLMLVMVLLPTAFAFQLVRRELQRHGVKVVQFGAVGEVARVLDELMSKSRQSFSGLLQSAKAAVSDAKDGARPSVDASRFEVGSLDLNKKEDMGKMRNRMKELMNLASSRNVAH